MATTEDPAAAAAAQAAAAAAQAKALFEQITAPAFGPADNDQVLISYR